MQTADTLHFSFKPHKKWSFMRYVCVSSKYISGKGGCCWLFYLTNLLYVTTLKLFWFILYNLFICCFLLSVFVSYFICCCITFPKTLHSKGIRGSTYLNWGLSLLWHSVIDGINSCVMKKGTSGKFDPYNACKAKIK